MMGKTKGRIENDNLQEKYDTIWDKVIDNIK